MTIDIAVGVLALQGAFYEHVELLRQAATEVALNDGQRWEFVEVRTTQELERCEGLIIPGERVHLCLWLLLDQTCWNRYGTSSSMFMSLNCFITT